MHVNGEYTERIHMLLDGMVQMQEFSIDENVSPENKDSFIEIVKEYITEEDPMIEFNQDYTKIRRLDDLDSFEGDK